MKKFLIALLSASCALTAIGLAACDEGHTHDYTDIETAPTCTEQGYTTHTCDCGDEYVDTYVEKLGHSFTVYASNGNGTETATCDRSGCSQTDTRAETPANPPADPGHTHDYTDVVTIPPTCTEQGYTTHTCNCGDYFVDSYVNALEHSFSDYIYDDNETCEVDGTETATCDRDGCEETDSRTVADTAGHIFDNYEYDNNATCEEDGTETAVCEREDCGESDTRTAEYTATGHEYSQMVATKEHEATAATCKKIATYYYSCKCGANADYTFEDGGYAPHNYVEGECTYCSKVYWDDLHYNLYGDFYMVSIGNCDAKDIVIPATYENLPIAGIDSSGFSGADITSIEIGENVKEIHSGAFSQCVNLTGIVIPDSVEYIGASAFAGCASLTSVTIGSGVTTIEEGAFAECASLTSFTVAADNETYCAIDGDLYTKDGTTLLQYAAGKTATTYVVPQGVTTIAPGAFSYITNLTSVTIGSGVTSIGWQAFKYCTGLEEIIIPGSAVSISSEAFYRCTGLKRVTITDGITGINARAFYGCSSLTEIVISSTLKFIDSDVFDECSSLGKVYYMGSASDWSGITIGSKNEELTNAPRYYYVESEGDVPSDGGNYWHYVDGVPTAW